ncbi:hypothetical protein PS900_05505 [Pseudomonas fluorescens]|uniref:Uncharacterized protein n=1 Tax=Pseudomonas fluorescens TaxID=294 RepID=A0A8H2NX22_PSEFL|nr:hypothetical protein PS900_05505 [Pseudomonas fluorescens]
MPGCPLHRTSTRPLEGARRSKAKAKARRPTGRPVCWVRSSVMYLVVWQAAIVGTPPGPNSLPQVLSTSERFRSAGRPSSRASPLPQVLSTSARFRSAGRPPSRAGSLPQGIGYTFKNLVGWQAAIASSLLQQSKYRAAYTTALHHSSGRALARLQLLILIHPPPRQAEWRRSSGGGRVAPFGEAEHIERRSSEADRRRCPRMNAAAKEPRALARGRTFGASVFWVTFFRRL